jgi:alpha-L-rhamnosidase
MLSKGGDVLREHFDVSQGSYNHAMFTSYSTWLIEKIVGIGIMDQATHANKVKIAPYFPEDMSDASGHVNTINGMISSHWKRVGHTIQMTLKIPKGIEFDLQLDEPYQLTQTDLSFYTELQLNIEAKA